MTDVTCTGLEDALLQCQFAVELSIRNCTPCGVVCAGTGICMIHYYINAYNV